MQFCSLPPRALQLLRFCRHLFLQNNLGCAQLADFLLQGYLDRAKLFGPYLRSLLGFQCSLDLALQFRSLLFDSVQLFGLLRDSLFQFLVRIILVEQLVECLCLFVNESLYHGFQVVDLGFELCLLPVQLLHITLQLSLIGGQVLDSASSCCRRHGHLLLQLRAHSHGGVLLFSDFFHHLPHVAVLLGELGEPLLGLMLLGL
mmetsp:Transcript_43493/g.132343  ORF Transcript_43493/g.132343 Transcript_43493/m.132343 type:complete len:202 (+) Transcript_43493:809-1414(+)